MADGVLQGNAPEDRPDAELVADVLDGRREAFALLVNRYQHRMYRHAAALVMNHDTAADLVQDAFVRAYVSLRQCREPARFRAWLFRTLRNRCLDHLKEARRRDVGLADAAQFVDTGEAPDSAVDRGRLQDELARALEALPAAQREAFLLHYVEGVPYEEMAELLDASVSALKMRVLRAREALSARLSHRDVTGLALARL